jgi:hypothetical protein
VDYGCQPAVNEHHKRNNYKDEAQERSGINDPVYLFEDAPNNPDRCDRQNQRREAEER